MKYLISLLLLFFSPLTWAEAVSHTHGGRAHTHPLPEQGIAHQHRGGARGEPIHTPPNRGGGSITGQVRYGEQALQQPPGSGIRSQPGQPVGDARLGVPTERRPDVAIRTVPPTVQADNKAHYRGDTRCRWGERDCNRCAPNIRQQFQRAAAGQLRWRSGKWGFIWNKNYPPHNKKPLAIFDGEPVYALGIPNKHVQGFVRTNSARFPYAGTHSHKRQGGIFLLRQDAQKRVSLALLKTAQSKHPSGMQAFGQYVLYGERNRLKLQDLGKPAKKPLSLALPRQPKANFGGGVAMVRLAKNRYLLVTTGPGGQDQRPRFNRFYQVDGRRNQPQHIRFVHQSRVQPLPRGPQTARFAENLSLITECGSGDIYAIHSTGDEGVGAVAGRGYWRLSKLAGRGEQLYLQTLQAFSQRQNMKSCSMRAAASVSVTPRGQLAFHCHGYARDPQRTLLGILGSSGKNRDRFHFKTGVLP